MSIASSVFLNPLGVISAIVSTLEAGLYSNVEAGSHHEGRIVGWIRSSSIARFRVIQTVMSVANSILLFIPTYIVTENVLTKLQLAPIYPNADNFVYILTCSGAALAATMALGAFILNRLSRTPKRQVGEVEITTANTKTQLVAKAILIGKIALAIIASFYVKNPLWFALTAVSTSYSLLKNYRIKCLNFTRDPHPLNFSRPALNSPFWMPEANTIDKVVTTYRMLQIPPTTHASQNDNCGICHKQLPDMGFCAKHLFHQRCLERKVGDATGSILEAAKFTKCNITYTGKYSGTSHKYEVDLIKRNMPACFTCRVVPPQNNCLVKVHDRLHGIINAKVTVKN